MIPVGTENTVICIWGGFKLEHSRCWLRAATVSVM